MSRPVTLVGHCCVDRVTGSDGKILLRAGGVPHYAGAAFAKLGRPCHIITKYNPIDTVVAEALTKIRGSVDKRPARSSTVFEFSEVDGEIGEPKLVTEGDPITSVDLLSASGQAIYFAPLTPNDIATDCYQSARKDGKLIFLDAQGITRREANARNRSAAHAVLALVDAVKVTSAEAKWLFGTDRPADVQAAFKQLGIQEVALTIGSKGSIVISPSGMVEVSERPVEAADKVGCGDVYFASYIDARLSGLPSAVAGQCAATYVAKWLQNRTTRSEEPDLALVEGGAG